MSVEEVKNIEQEKKPRQFWDKLIHLEDGVDRRSIIQEIKSKSHMSGPNAWMLICSIMIASIGLNMNSPAVIIGAMLISPLMSPILGMGLGVGINDQDLLKQCLRHFGVAVLIAVITSTIYFFLTPFKELTSEINARTTPTFLDVVIGFFGGIAGIVSIARKDISTTLPGVAIATALMPPLCVTGYGIATGEWLIASKSFYLFFLNTFFVSLATYFIIRYLNFPHRQFVNPKERRRNIVGVIFFSTIAIIPSLYIFTNMYKEFQTEQNLKSFIQNYIADDQIYLDEYTLLRSDSTSKLVMKVYGDEINSNKIPYYLEGLEASNIKNTEINIIPTSEIDIDRMHLLESKVSGVEKIASNLEIATRENEKMDKQIEFLENEMATLRMDSIEFTRMCNEFKILFPDLESISLANTQSFDFSDYNDKETIIILNWNKRISSRTMNLHALKIESIMEMRPGFEKVEIINR